jgi:hypothetical protein
LHKKYGKEIEKEALLLRHLQEQVEFSSDIMKIICNKGNILYIFETPQMKKEFLNYMGVKDAN